MLRFGRISVPTSLLVVAGIEGFLVLCSFYFGLVVSWVEFSGAPGEILFHLPKALLYTGILLLVMFCFGLYQREHFVDRAAVVSRLVVSFAVAFGLLAMIFYTLPILEIWRSIIAAALVSAFLVVMFFRLILLDRIDLKPFRQRILVVGAGEQAAQLEKLQQGSWPAGFAIIGYLGLDEGEDVAVPKDRLLPRVNSLTDFIDQERIDQIVVAVRGPQELLPSRALLDCRLAGVEVVDFVTFYAHHTGRIDIDEVDPDWFLFSDGFWGVRSYKTLKRALDVCLSSVLLVVFSPIWLVIAIAIWLEDRGPVFYGQERVGLRQKPFRMFKFRSMTTNAEPDGVARWAVPDDTRTTKVGSFLRRTRLDEMPQFINILKGDMSLVGPRPERPVFVDQFANEIEFYADRHAVRPGLTGWAQLHYRYAASEEESKRKLEYDLYYVKFFGLFLDLVIILQTIRVVIWPNGVR